MAAIIKYDPDQSQLAISGRELRDAIKRIVEEAAPLARVHARWQLKFKLGESVELLKSNKFNKKVRGWMITISANDPLTQDGALESRLTVTVWGVHEYEQSEDQNGLTSEDRLDVERRELERLWSLNRSFLAMDDPSGLQEVSLLAFPDIDTAPFGGVDCHVAQGQATIRLREQLVKQS